MEHGVSVNAPCVLTICNDTPGLFDSAGLSHDQIKLTATVWRLEISFFLQNLGDGLIWSGRKKLFPLASIYTHGKATHV